jgi:hypothetical protein
MSVAGRARGLVTHRLSRGVPSVERPVPAARDCGFLSVARSRARGRRNSVALLGASGPAGINERLPQRFEAGGRRLRALRVALDADDEARARSLEGLDEFPGLAGRPAGRDEARGAWW